MADGAGARIPQMMRAAQRQSRMAVSVGGHANGNLAGFGLSEGSARPDMQ